MPSCVGTKDQLVEKLLVSAKKKFAALKKADLCNLAESEGIKVTATTKGEKVKKGKVSGKDMVLKVIKSKAKDHGHKRLSKGDAASLLSDVMDDLSLKGLRGAALVKQIEEAREDGSLDSAVSHVLVRHFQVSDYESSLPPTASQLFKRMR
jgi:hypothetical protein